MTKMASYALMKENLGVVDGSMHNADLNGSAPEKTRNGD